MLFKSDPPHVVLFALWWLSMVWNGHLIDSREMLTVGGHLQFSPLGPINLRRTYSTLKCPLVPPVTPSTDLQSRTTNQQKQVLLESYQTSSWKDSLKVSYFISDSNRILVEYRCHSLTSDPNIHSFLLLKDGGVFQKPSAGIIAVFTESESCFKELWEDLWQTSPRTRFSISCQDWRTMLQRWQKKKQQKTVPRAGFTTLTPLLKTTIGTCWQKWQLAFIGVFEWTIWRMNSSLVEVSWMRKPDRL